MNHAYNRRNFLKTLSLTAASFALPGCARFAAQHTPNKKPNIILIMADDLGYGDISCYGSTIINTPNIDRLAKAGMKFKDFHSNCPVCSPTRAALVTGRYQQRSGVEGVVTAKNHRDKGMPLKEKTFAELLKPAGYTSAIFGKWHLGYLPKFNPVTQGFDDFVGYVSGNVDYQSHIDQAGFEDWWHRDKKTPEKGYSTHLITHHAIRFIEKNADNPFCLYVPHEAPHYPFQGPSDKPQRTTKNFSRPKSTMTKDKLAYKQMIEAMDQGIGQIVDTLKKLQLLNNTFIFFCSDNGASSIGSNAPLSGFKGSLAEGGHRVPAVAHWPGRIKPNTTSNQTAMTMDLTPTMLDLAGIQKPSNLKFDGVSLLPHLLEQKPLPQRTLFWRFGNQKAVRKGPWKLFISSPNNKNTQTIALYHLDDDLAEKNNLARTHPEKVKSLQRELNDWQTEVTRNVIRQS